jgi:hypothetical protein
MSAYPPSKTDTLLDYALSPDPDPPQAGKRLALSFEASKRDEKRQVFCDRLRFHFDVDDSPCRRATYLTCTSGGVEQAATPAGDWDPLDSPPGTFRFVPSQGRGHELTKGYTFELFDIAVSSLLGTATVTVTEHSTDHDQGHCPNHDHAECYQNRVATFDVPKFPKGFGQVVFQTDKTTVAQGGEAQLSWQGDTSALYELLANDQPIAPKAIKKNTVGDVTTWSYRATALTDDTVFTLRVSHQASGRTVRREYYIPIHVRTPRVTKFHAVPDRVDYQQSVHLEWETVNADGTYLVAGHKERKPLASVSDPEKPETLQPEFGVPYMLVPYKGDQEGDQRQLVLTFNKPEISFAADPASLIGPLAADAVIETKPATTLSWKVKNAKSVTYQGQRKDATEPVVTGSQIEHPTEPTKYYLVATHLDGTEYISDAPVEIRRFHLEFVPARYSDGDTTVTVNLTIPAGKESGISVSNAHMQFRNYHYSFDTARTGLMGTPLRRIGEQWQGSLQFSFPYCGAPWTSRILSFGYSVTGAFQLTVHGDGAAWPD